NGDIVVTGATAGSKVSIYNLQGHLLKTQTVTAGTEILETAGFPRGVYIVAVDDLRRKVVKN
ncbi:MAG: T9SS type A sorting domain-containing protein, partial [Dysgonamonadaceae bacterium]|nr:T9SS type A sorting domain-containing protein [Dysgonamonadaceae bacterium]